MLVIWTVGYVCISRGNFYVLTTTPAKQMQIDHTQKMLSRHINIISNKQSPDLSWQIGQSHFVNQLEVIRIDKSKLSSKLPKFITIQTNPRMNKYQYQEDWRSA